MLTVEIKEKIWVDPDGEEHISDYIIVNGIADEESFYIKHEVPTVHLRNGKIFDILNSHSFKTVSEHFKRYTFYIQLDHWTPNSCELEIVCGEYYHLKVPYINFKLSFENWEHWSKPWSMLNVATEFCNRTQELENEKIEYWQEDDDSILNGFGIKYYASDSDFNIQSELDWALHNITSILKKRLKVF